MSKLFASIAAIGLAVGFGIFIASLICNIHPQESYSGIYGIWHGLFIIPNYVRHIIDPSILYKAASHSTMYNILWWIALIGQTPSILLFVFRLVIYPIAAVIVATTNIYNDLQNDI